MENERQMYLWFDNVAYKLFMSNKTTAYYTESDLTYEYLWILIEKPFSKL